MVMVCWWVMGRGDCECEILQGASFSLSLCNGTAASGLLCQAHQLSSLFIGEMSALKRALEVDREAAEQRLVNKLKLDPPPTFFRSPMRINSCSIQQWRTSWTPVMLPSKRPLMQLRRQSLL